MIDETQTISGKQTIGEMIRKLTIIRATGEATARIGQEEDFDLHEVLEKHEKVVIDGFVAYINNMLNTPHVKGVALDLTPNPHEEDEA